MSTRTVQHGWSRPGQHAVHAQVSCDGCGKRRTVYTWPGSNWRPSACEADVIATRPQVLVVTGPTTGSTRTANPGHRIYKPRPSGQLVKHHPGAATVTAAVRSGDARWMAMDFWMPAADLTTCKRRR